MLRLLILCLVLTARVTSQEGENEASGDNDDDEPETLDIKIVPSNNVELGLESPDTGIEDEDVSAQWNVWMPRDISTMTNSCVVIPCTFMYPGGSAAVPGRPRDLSRTDIVHESYKGRTKLLGELQQRNCTLRISNVGTEHSGRYYFRADLGGANIFTYPDFSELKGLEARWCEWAFRLRPIGWETMRTRFSSWKWLRVAYQPNIDVPEEIVSNENLELTCYAPDNCPVREPPKSPGCTRSTCPTPQFSTDYLEESNTAVLSNTLTFVPRPMHNGMMLGCRVHFPNTSFSYERLITLDVKYSPRSVWVNVTQEVMEDSTVTLFCEVDSNPVPRISWFFGEEEQLSETALNATLVLDGVGATAGRLIHLRGR
ncbi:hypothetical protein SKAU_G00418280 [Synaphobranchus kaupii]|uniref:Ig-like domain-containing protein n=1 Tax=Synaphobranchus kaupii TaxID=118154 RepID=A0A9Q1E686_SYNKA|nr:hypothetical protein SKAU_G00418280 [Synaphobranchus kaupii]